MRIGNNTPIEGKIVSQYVRAYDSKIRDSLAMLASGNRINSASQDSTAFFKSESLNSRANTVAGISRNLETHTSRLETADGYLKSIQEVLEEMSSLASEASGESNSVIRESLGKEYDTLYDSLNTLITTSRYEGNQLFTGDYDSASGGTGITVQLDEDPTNDNYTYEILDATIDSSTGLNLNGYNGAEVAWEADAANATSYYEALNNEDRGLVRLERNMNRLGTHQTIIGGSVNSLNIKENNYLAASNSLVGVDYAAESTRLSSLEIRKQAALSFLSQNNLSRASVYSVLSQQMIPK